MSRSSYERTSKTNSGAVYDRDYDERKERERERGRSADRYDSDNSRHHGKWTAQSETEELEGSALPGAYTDARRSTNLGPKSFSERENYNNNGEYYRGSRSASNYNQGYDNYSSGYGNNYSQGYGQSGYAIPNPPPMPPRDFWHPAQHYRSSHPYLPQYGSSGYDGSSFAGMHPQSSGHHMYQGTGNFAQDIQRHASELMHTQGYGQGYGQSYGQGYGYGSRDLGYGSSSYGYGSMPHSLGHQSYEYVSPSYDVYELESSRSLGGLGGLGGLALGNTHHLELGTTRPHVDIYELGNEYIIELDMPGHTRDHIETKLFGNELVISSRPPKRDFKYHINERPLGKHEVTRKFYLPTDVNATKINATLTNGVLRVVLPRGVPAATVPSTTTVVDTTGSTTTTTQAVVV